MILAIIPFRRGIRFCYKGTTRNFNPLMATAADIVIAAAEKIVPTGEIQGESVVTPGIFIDYIVGGEPA